MALGADVGGSRIESVRLEDQSIVLRRQVQIADDWLTQLADELTQLAQPYEPVAVGVAGLVDHTRGILRWAPHLSGTDVPVGPELSRALGRQVMVDNDANCAARAEASRLRLDPVAVVMIGTGIGMGFWTAGGVFRGGGFAGEAGHIPVEKDGGSCRCGRRGCWETRVSGWRLEELGNDDSAIHEMGVWLGHGLATLITLLDPEVIVLGGGLIDDCGARLIDPAVAELERRSDLYRPAPVVMRSEHGLWSGAVGAAMLASL